MLKQFVNLTSFMLLSLGVVSCSADDDSKYQNTNDLEQSANLGNSIIAANTQISLLLSDSKAAFDDAIDGSWVGITASEYATLQENLSNVSIAGAQEVDMSEHIGSSLARGTSYFFDEGDNFKNIPANHAVCALHINTSIGDNVLSLRASDTKTGNYDEIANDLVIAVNDTDDLDMYFALKSNTIFENESYLSVYDANAWINLVGGTSKITSVRFNKVDTPDTEQDYVEIGAPALQLLTVAQ